jgi:hypothetical protein
VRQHQKAAAQYKNKMPLDFLFQNLVSKLQSDSQRERYERFSLARRFVPLLAKTLNVRWSRARLVIARPPSLPPLSESWHSLTQPHAENNRQCPQPKKGGPPYRYSTFLAFCDLICREQM